MPVKLEFTGRHIDVTPALKNHVTEQFERIETVFKGRTPKAHVIIEVERGRHRSEIIVNWRNETLTATSTNDDMYVSLSQTVGKIERQARKLKDKVIGKSHRAKKSAVIGAEVEAVPPERNGEPQIIVTKRYAVKPMAPEEAALMLDGNKNGFLLFRDSESGGISLIHRRPDGNFGLIQP